MGRPPLFWTPCLVSIRYPSNAQTHCSTPTGRLARITHVPSESSGSTAQTPPPQDER